MALGIQTALRQVEVIGHRLVTSHRLIGVAIHRRKWRLDAAELALREHGRLARHFRPVPKRNRAHPAATFAAATQDPESEDRTPLDLARLGVIAHVPTQECSQGKGGHRPPFRSGGEVARINLT